MRQDLSLRLEQFKKQYVADEAVRSRIAEPPVKFIGDEIMELAVAALLQGENVLLSGGKATGKNILADNLAWLFARPVYTVSFHVNTDSSTLIGTDTFTGGEVRLRRGPVALAAQYGGFCILDEINMAKNDAVAVLHSALDYRRLIDVPGYECIPIHPAARFIATMNYGYAGTRELNEALVSRFTVIRMPTLEEPQLCELLRANVPEASDENIKRCTGLFLDLNAKAVNGEISTNSVDMRGMIAALHLMTDGMAPKDAIAVSITNKCFDEYEYAVDQAYDLTPVGGIDCLKAEGNYWGSPCLRYMNRQMLPLFLAAIWGAALAGILLKLLWLDAPRWLGTGLYLALGWAIAADLKDFGAMPGGGLALVAAGGVCYSAGAVIYLVKRPNLGAGWGFHELFHLFILAGSAFHFAAVYAFVL